MMYIIGCVHFGYVKTIERILKRIARDKRCKLEDLIKESLFIIEGSKEQFEKGDVTDVKEIYEMLKNKGSRNDNIVALFKNKDQRKSMCKILFGQDCRNVDELNVIYSAIIYKLLQSRLPQGKGDCFFIVGLAHLNFFYQFGMERIGKKHPYNKVLIQSTETFIDSLTKYIRRLKIYHSLMDLL